MQLRLGLVLTFALGLFVMPELSAEAGVSGNTYAGTVTLITPDGSPVPFEWVITFNADKTLNLVAEGIPQPGTYQEINLGVISFYRTVIDNEFQSEFTGICLMSKLNILRGFSDTDANTLESGVLRLVSLTTRQRPAR